MISLCLLEPKDLPAVLRIVEQPDVAEMLCWPREELSEANIAKWLTASITGEAKVFALSDSEYLLGVISLNDIDWQNRRATSRYAFVDRNSKAAIWHMVWLVRNLLSYAFSLGLHRVDARIREDNAAIQTVYARLGAKREGLHRDAIFFDGRFHNLVSYAKCQSDN